MRLERAQLGLSTGLDQCIERGTRHLLSLQAEDGYWWAELESNVTMAAEHLLLEQFLGIHDSQRWQKLARYLLEHQLPDGSWPVYAGGPGNVSVSAEAYFALKLAGKNPTDPEMVSACNFIRAQGGIASTRIFTKFWLALFGLFDWRALPAMPPEAILLSPQFPFNIYEFASWARATMVPILIAWALRPVVAIPARAAPTELFLAAEDAHRIRFRRDRRPLTWRNGFLLLDRLLQVHERLPWKPLRARAIRACERWILDHQEADGSWGGIQPPWVYSLIALKCLGYANDHPVMTRGIDGLLHEFALETDATFTMQPCLSPVWDTALAVTGLREAGLPADHLALVRAGRWLLAHEIRGRGDWCVKVPGVPPGGWAFEFANERYPDTDDTAEVLIALRLLDLGQESEGAASRAMRWLDAMQSRNGGWGAFDKDNTKEFVKSIPFADFGAALDPPTADVTAHVVEALLLEGRNANERAMAQALHYLRGLQEADGSWWGRWGVNYVYGLGAVLPALVAAGEEPQQPHIQAAVRWLYEHQNADGGWGESCASYDDPALAGLGESTASQTAWALLALLAAGAADSEAVHRGVDYLIATQEPNGEWLEPQFTGTGFPRDFMLKYHLYRIYWPLWALGRYRRVLSSNPIHEPESDPHA